MNKNIFSMTAIIATTLTISACAPMPQTGPLDPYTPVVTAPLPQEPVDMTHVPTTPAAPLEQYVVQLTASNSANKAERIREQFVNDGYNAFVSPLTVNGRVLHRVQIGMFNNMNDANMLLAQMRTQYPADPYVAGAIAKTPFPTQQL